MSEWFAGGTPSLLRRSSRLNSNGARGGTIRPLAPMSVKTNVTFAFLLVVVLACSQAAPAQTEWVDTQVGRAVRVSRSVKAPAVLKRVDPRYPEVDRANRVQGLVILHVVIDEKGKVINVERIEAPSITLGEAAWNAVSQWQYTPSTVDGQQVKLLLPVPINFKLD